MRRIASQRNVNTSLADRIGVCQLERRPVGRLDNLARPWIHSSSLTFAGLFASFALRKNWVDQKRRIPMTKIRIACAFLLVVFLSPNRAYPDVAGAKKEGKVIVYSFTAVD